MAGMSQVVSLASGREGGSMADGRTLDFHSTSAADLLVEAIPHRGDRLVGWLVAGLPQRVLHGGFASLAAFLKVIPSPCMQPHLALL